MVRHIRAANLKATTVREEMMLDKERKEDALPDQSSIGFVNYDQETRKTFDDRSRRLLDQLYAKFSSVEVSDLNEKKWCVRVICTDNAKEPLPLAAIGNSPHQAAERLWRISTFF